MSCFQLPPNFVEDPEQLLRRTRRHQVSPQRFILETELLVEESPATVVEAVMVQKTIAEFSSPSADFVAMGPNELG